MRKKFASVLLAVVMLLSLTTFAGAANTVTVNKGDIVVLYTNDVHCAVDTNIGYAGLAAYRNDMEKRTDYVTLVDDGDAVQGGAIGTLSKGAYIVDIMNDVGYDIAVPGNHEFDYGMDTFMDLADQLDCGYTCCNFIDKSTGNPVFPAYRMMTYGDTKVAYVGIDTPETFSKSTPAYFQDASGRYIYGFCEGNDGQDLYDAVQNAITAAKTDGADYVIAVGHCGTDEQSAPWRSTDIIANVTGLSAFIDGHSHSVIASDKVTDKDGKTVLLTSTGTKFANIGRLVLKPSSGTVSTELISSYDKKDTDVDAFVKDIQAKNQGLLDTGVATSDVNLTIMKADGTTRAVRSEETNLGDLCADAYRVVGNADIGWVNGGGVRADIASGDVTYGDIINVFPFNNALCVKEVTGQQILDALEMAARNCPSENGGFLQVSGLTYTIDTTVPSTVTVNDKGEFTGVTGARRVKNVYVGSAAIDPTQTYTLASHDYMLKNGGDGLVMFKNDKTLVDGTMLDNQVLIQYITDNLDGTITDDYASAQGRITVIRTPFTDVNDTDWFYNGIVYAYGNNLFSGKSHNVFSPYGLMTRAQIMTVLWRMAGSPDPTDETSFKDVSSKQYYAKAVAWAVENQIATGYNKNTFQPNRPVTREQLAAFLYNYANVMGYDATAGGMAIREYADYDQISGFASQALAWANAAGLIQGYTSDSTIRPHGSATRAQVAVILQRFSQNVKTAE